MIFNQKSITSKITAQLSTKSLEPFNIKCILFCKTESQWVSPKISEQGNIKIGNILNPL